MRTLLKVRVPVEAGNKAIKDGSLPRTIEGFVSEHKPEAAYFTTEDGERTFLFVVDLKDASFLPAAAERFFMGMEARIDATIVMNHEELRAGLQRISGKISS